MNAIFERELNKLCSGEKILDGEYAFKAIQLLKELYLRMFSETEFFPDFINSEMDHLSEWSGKEVNGDYKNSLATALCLQIHSGSKKNALLGLYFKTTTDQAIKAAKSKINKEAPLIDQFKLLCIIQVMQSLQVASNKELKSIDCLSKSVSKTFSPT